MPGPNQPPPLEGYNLFTTDPVLPDVLRREGSNTGHTELVAFGERVGSTEVFGWGADANRFEPELETHDRFGDRIDQVRFHPAYHSLMATSINEGIHCRHY